LTGLYHGWSGEEDDHADFLHGGVDPSDFDETMPHRKKRGKKRPIKKRGCPENDFGPHIYVWTTESFRKGDGSFDDWLWQYEKDFWDKNGFHRREYKTCAGCKKRAGSRYTEEFAKRVQKMGWYKANYGDR